MTGVVLTFPALWTFPKSEGAAATNSNQQSERIAEIMKRYGGEFGEETIEGSN